jgi:hypothetical protein
LKSENSAAVATSFDVILVLPRTTDSETRGWCSIIEEDGVEDGDREALT